ncbi:hypothetical protein D3C85_1424600 [compost metagenome]
MHRLISALTLAVDLGHQRGDFVLGDLPITGTLQAEVFQGTGIARNFEPRLLQGLLQLGRFGFGLTTGLGHRFRVGLDVGGLVFSRFRRLSHGRRQLLRENAGNARVEGDVRGANQRTARFPFVKQWQHSVGRPPAQLGDDGTDGGFATFSNKLFGSGSDGLKRNNSHG